MQDTRRKPEIFTKLDAMRTSLDNSGLYLNILVIGFGSADSVELSELSDSGIFAEDATATDFINDDLTNNASKRLCSRPVRPAGKEIAILK